MQISEEGKMEQYFAVLERQKEQLEKAKAYKGQSPTSAMKRSRKQLESEYTNIALSMQMQKLMDPTQNSIRNTFIGEAYPPCTEPISTLAPITLRELKLETHHRGRVLIVRTFGIPTRMLAIQSAIEDENNDVDRLAIQNLPLTAVTEKVLPSGAIIAIKEPYYKTTADGGVMIRVDHPSDFLHLESGNTLVPAGLRSISGQNNKSATELKENGNTVSKCGDWETAADYYTEALGLCQGAGEDLRRILYRNRAHARLHLGHYEWALNDALNSVIPGDALTDDFKSQNIKAFFRAGRAEYEIGNFGQAQLQFQRALELDANQKEILAELRRTTNRLAEQEEGKFDLAAMSMSANKNHVRLDHASFVKNTKVASAGNRGRGLFATKDLKRGDLIIVEKAFCVAHENDAGGTLSMLININTNRGQLGTHAQRFVMLVDKVAHNPKQASLYLDLFDGGRSATEEVKVVDGKVVIDTFQVLAIAGLNGFGCPAVKSGDAAAEDPATASHRGSTGIWLRASYCNHRCLPNANRSFIGDMMVVQANQDIKAGEEIFLAYSSFEVYAERKKHLDFYGFQCDCNLCKSESKVPAKVVKERARLVGEAKKFISENEQTLASRTPSTQKAKKGKELVRQLRTTYDEKAFGHLPRLDCVQLGLWLCRRGGFSPNEGIKDAVLVLRDLGYFFKLSDSGSSWGQVDASNGFAVEAAVHAAMYAGQALAAIDNGRAALAFHNFAKKGYVLNHGSDEGFDAKYT